MFGCLNKSKITSLISVLLRTVCFKNYLNILQQNFPFLKEKKLLIAISGGIDSVVLTHLLSALNFNISLAHCNFNLRNTESDLDTVFVKELAEKLQIKCFTTSFETEKIAKENKESIQITARNLRYTWFQETLQEHHFDFVLTAHHADDNLETFLDKFNKRKWFRRFYRDS